METASYFNYKQTVCFGLYTEHENLTAIGTSYIYGDFIPGLVLFGLFVYDLQVAEQPTNFFLCN